MTQKKTKEVSDLMKQMDLELQEYAITMLRHLKAAQSILVNQNSDKPQQTA